MWYVEELTFLISYEALYENVRLGPLTMYIESEKNHFCIKKATIPTFHTSFLTTK